jgi:hypothetical protein
MLPFESPRYLTFRGGIRPFARDANDGVRDEGKEERDVLRFRPLVELRVVPLVGGLEAIMVAILAEKPSQRRLTC